MTTSIKLSLAVALSALATITVSNPALAGDPLVVGRLAPGSEVQTETVRRDSVPNYAILGSGLVIFGISYGTSVVVAATSDLPEDHHLFIPILGPWIDFANRGGCGGVAGPSCDTETTNRVLLVVDGVVQAIGALTVLDAFFTPESHTVTRTRAAKNGARVYVAPGGVGTGYGLVAVGGF